MKLPQLLTIFLGLCAISVQGQNSDQANQEKTTNGPGLNIEIIEDRKIDSNFVTAVPVTSVFTENGKQFVLAQSEENPLKFDIFEVEVGKSDGQYIEVKSGVFPGDKIATRTEPMFTKRSRSQPSPISRISTPPTPSYEYTQNNHRQINPRERTTQPYRIDNTPRFAQRPPTFEDFKEALRQLKRHHSRPAERPNRIYRNDDRNFDRQR